MTNKAIEKRRAKFEDYKEKTARHLIRAVLKSVDNQIYLPITDLRKDLRKISRKQQTPICLRHFQG
jgi:hypothetical protein